MTAIDWALYTERAVGRGSPNFADVVNRPLREVITISGADPDASFVGFSLVGHTHAATDIVSGTLPATRGGTGVASPTAGGLLVAAGALAMTVLAPGVAGRIVRDNGTAWAASAIVTADISDAASINTPSVAVKRDGSGNFSAGTITAALTGNASTATALATPRTINGVSVDGSGNITVTATAPNALTIGTHLTGGSYNGSASITIATDATALNTASTIVSRDGSGNFAAGTITASFTGPLTGTAALATALATPRNINGVAFDGTAPITVAAAASTLTGTTLASNVATSSLTAVGTLATGVWNASVVGAAYGGTGVANTNTITLGGNITTASAFTTAGAFGITLTATALTSVTLPTTGTLVNTAGNVASATALATARTIAITGDISYTSPGFDGSGNVSAAGTLATVNANVGSFGSSTAIPVVTVNGKGLVTAMSTAAAVAPAGTLTGTTLAANVVGSSLTSVGTLTSLTVAGASSLQAATATTLGLTSATASIITTLSGSTANRTFLSMGRAAEEMRIGLAAGASSIINGDAAGDVDFLSFGHNMNWSIDSGASIGMSLSSTGLRVASGLAVSAGGITLGAGNASFAGVVLAGSATVGVSVTAAAGDVVVPNASRFGSLRASDSAFVALAQLDAADLIVHLGDQARQVIPALPLLSGVAASANRKGGLYADTGTAGQVVLFDAVTGARYKFVGTAF
jgi:hypothetical protein